MPPFASRRTPAGGGSPRLGVDRRPRPEHASPGRGRQDPTDRLTLASEHRAPCAILRGPREMVAVEHRQSRGWRWGRLPRSGRDGNRVKRDARLGIVQDARQELGRGPDVVHRCTEEPVARGIEADEALALCPRVIQYFGPLQPQVVEQRLQDADAGHIGCIAEVPREPDLEPPRARQIADDAAGRLQVGRGARDRGGGLGPPARLLGALGGEPRRERDGEGQHAPGDRCRPANPAHAHGVIATSHVIICSYYNTYTWYISQGGDMAQYRGEKVRYRRRGLLRLRLRQLLEARGLSAYGLAKFTGLSLNTIYRLTRPTGRFSLIRADTIERLCGALRTTPGELFEYKKPTAS